MLAPRFSLRLPPVQNRTAWVGFYSDMNGTVVMVFSRKPAPDSAMGHISVNDPAYIGSVWIEDWEAWFGRVQPFADAGLIEHQGDGGWVATPLDCRDTIEIELTAAWSGQWLAGLDTRADN